MDALSTWELWLIVVGGAVIISISVLLLGLALMVLLGWWTGVREPPALIPIAGHFRRLLFQRSPERVAELERSEPAVVAQPGSSPPIQF